MEGNGYQRVSLIKQVEISYVPKYIFIYLLGLVKHIYLTINNISIMLIHCHVK
jgi:hypothetical protein